MKVSILGPTNLEFHRDLLNVYKMRHALRYNLRREDVTSLEDHLDYARIPEALASLKKTKVARTKRGRKLVRKLVTIDELIEKGERVGEIIAQSGHTLATVMGYEGMLKAIGHGYKKAGGPKLEMYWCRHDDGPWEAKKYIAYTRDPDVDEAVHRDSWKDVLLHLVADSEIIVCAGESGGVLLEEGLIRFNEGESIGKLQRFVGLTDLLTEGRMNPVFTQYIRDKLVYTSSSQLKTEHLRF